MKTSRTARHAVAVAVALALTVAACGGDDDSASEPATEEPAAEEPAAEEPAAEEPAAEEPAAEEPAAEEPAAEEPTGEPIKVGTVVWANPAVSPYLRYPGIQSAIHAINQSGGIDGRPVEWKLCEYNEDPNEGLNCVQEMIDEGVVATVGDFPFNIQVDIARMLGDAGIPQIDPFFNDPEAINSPSTFMLCAPTPIQYAAVVLAADLAGVESIHYIAGDLPDVENSFRTLDPTAEMVGIEVKGDPTLIPLQAPDYSPFATEAADVGADLDIPVVAPFMTGLLLQASAQLELGLRIGVGEGQFNDVQYQQLGGAGGPLDGAVVVDCVPPRSGAADFPELQRALDEIAAFYAEDGDTPLPEEEITSITTRSWLGVQALARIAEAQDEVTAESVMNGLETMTVDLGVFEWTPSAEGPAGFEKVSNGNQYASIIQDGVPVLLQAEPVDGLAAFR